MLYDTKQDELEHLRDDDLERELLEAIFILWYGTMLKAVHTLTLRVFNLGPVPLDDPSIRRFLLEAKTAAAGVDATTRKAIAERLAEGARLGLTPHQIAYGTNDFPGIDGLFKNTWNGRAGTVARTELQKAQLAATVDRFRQLGKGIVTHVRAHDGDFDAKCQARNGKLYPISNPPDLLHPNCRLVVSPVFMGEV